MAVEGAIGLGRGIAQLLVAAGEPVVYVPAKVTARARLLSTSSARKTDPGTRRGRPGALGPSGLPPCCAGYRGADLLARPPARGSGRVGVVPTFGMAAVRLLIAWRPLSADLMHRS
jgi:hypothetical protein